MAAVSADNTRDAGLETLRLLERFPANWVPVRRGKRDKVPKDVTDTSMSSELDDFGATY